jgi:hypothetical protein
VGIDLDRLFRIDWSYPGLSFGYHSWALGVYLESMESFVGVAKEQYRVRARHALERRRAEFHPDELLQKQSEVDEAADLHIPRYARMCALVPIWGFFEVTVSDITQYIATRESAELKLKDIRASTFELQVEKYFAGVLRLPLPWSDNDRCGLRDLHVIRNAIAHRNGQYRDAGPERRKEIERAVANVSDVKFHGNQLEVGARYVEASAELVFRVLEQLNALVVARYDGTSAPVA